ncbi:GNAT family N-acetyltransferase [Deinococcus altitudinis]|uniref:GNAT family N-acetyltransferase n=1 Tax=Deinococcus altitudinis TaxID=468914 RepID=UPI0038918940
MEETATFRDFSGENYPTLAAFLTELRPTEPVSEDSLRRLDAGRATGEHHARTLAWAGAKLVGVVETERSRTFTRPGWYGLHVHAAGSSLTNSSPANPSLGSPSLRAELLKQGLNTLRPLSPTVLHTTLDEHAAEYRWLLQQGWREHERTWLSRLDLTTFRPEPFSGRLARSRMAGVEVRTPRELGWDGSESFQRRVYDLTVQLLADVPTTDPILPWPFELWRKRVLDHPDFTPDGPLIAVQQGEWVGLTELYLPRREVPGLLHQGLTGVRRGWRGQGVAWALKLTAAARARAQGWEAVSTGNHTVNREMLGINAEMGFVRGPARVVLVREWAEISAAAAPPSAC